jgi:hypothetical protein
MKYHGLFFLVFLSSAAFASEAHAVFQLQVSPRGGGQSVRFEVSEPGALLRNEEVVLSVVTDRAVQYRILQTVYQPLTNEMGATIPSNAFIMFSPSNTRGTLRPQLETPVAMGQTQIYTSNAAGESDEFVLALSVRVPENVSGGVYRTQITYTAEPVNAQGGVGPSTTTLDVRVEIQPKFRFEVRGERGSRALDLGRITKERSQAESSLSLEITSNIGSQYRVFHQLTEPLVSAQGDVLDERSMAFRVSGGSQGSVAAGANTPVPASQTLLYTSNEWGASDALRLDFALVPDIAQKAGIYRGNLSFRVDSRSPFVTQEVITVPVAIEVEPIFSFETKTDSGAGVNFGSFKPGQDRQERRVTLSVRSNLGEPYQISQIVPSALTTADGSPMPPEAFRFTVASPGEGTVKAPAGQPVQSGESVLYVSDPKGTPKDIEVQYVLEVPSQAKAGNYSSQIKYSMTTL